MPENRPRKPRKALQSPPKLSYLERKLMHKRGLKREEFSDLGTLLAEVGIKPTRAQRFIEWHVKRGEWEASKHAAVIRAIQSLYHQKRNAIIKQRKRKN